jgi:hypothetical protein
MNRHRVALTALPVNIFCYRSYRSSYPDFTSVFSLPLRSDKKFRFSKLLMLSCVPNPSSIGAEFLTGFVASDWGRLDWATGLSRFVQPALVEIF